MSTKFRENITTRYGDPDKEIYQKVMDIVAKENIPKSRAQLKLVERGLQHLGNPGPLIKEKTIYRDRPPVIKTVEKVVYKDRPKSKTEHIKGDQDISQQRPSGDTLSTGDKAGSPLDALGIKKSPPVDKKKDDWVGGFFAVGAIAALFALPHILEWLGKPHTPWYMR